MESLSAFYANAFFIFFQCVNPKRLNVYRKFILQAINATPTRSYNVNMLLLLKLL